ncbi:hypothetical protein TetV_387 [Tetraselmis virus 1]|uniref:Uncharacterized protein n=1 Tax=Tetraselmis virus 1 TaxID=2060617 RepID=A0A2P0VNY1_9VIRU|nr:hypothetical protein QJ968_gp387 [Tetraselmis virus 1]AUF82479.1 hypothetical protein TetV_387 [Tetraselmis virus 1]
MVFLLISLTVLTNEFDRFRIQQFDFIIAKMGIIIAIIIVIEKIKK